jgi:hypothetical protein
MHVDEVFYAILAISFFWTIGAVLFIQFPPLAKNVLMASKEVASLFLVMFSIGVAAGSIAINALLKGTVSARYSPISVIAMGGFVALFWFICRKWEASVSSTHLMDVSEFLSHPLAFAVLGTLLLIAIAGGEQHRQFRGDGRRHADRCRAERGQGSADRAGVVERRHVPDLGLAWPDALQGGKGGDPARGHLTHSGDEDRHRDQAGRIGIEKTAQVGPAQTPAPLDCDRLHTKAHMRREARPERVAGDIVGYDQRASHARQVNRIITIGKRSFARRRIWGHLAGTETSINAPAANGARCGVPAASLDNGNE